MQAVLEIFKMDSYIQIRLRIISRFNHWNFFQKHCWINLTRIHICGSIFVDLWSSISVAHRLISDRVFTWNIFKNHQLALTTLCLLCVDVYRLGIKDFANNKCIGWKREKLYSPCKVSSLRKGSFAMTRWS